MANAAGGGATSFCFGLATSASGPWKFRSDDQKIKPGFGVWTYPKEAALKVAKAPPSRLNSGRDPDVCLNAVL